MEAYRLDAPISESSDLSDSADLATSAKPVDAKATNAPNADRGDRVLTEGQDDTSSSGTSSWRPWRAPPIPTTSALAGALLTALVLFVLAYSWMFADISVPNERTRVYLGLSLVDDHSLRIDHAVGRFGPVNDWARYRGHYFTDKAPGSSVLAAAVYGVARAFRPPEQWSIAQLINLMRTWIMLPLGVLGFTILRRFLRRLAMPADVADVASLAWMLGTAAFHYSTAFYGHQIVAICMLGALYLVQDWEEGRSTREGFARAFGAGAIAGFAGFVEYQSAIPCVLFGVYVLSGPMRKSPTLLASFLLGSGFFVALLLGYNTLAFGGPLELSYHHLVAADLQQLHGVGIGGVSSFSKEFAVGGLLSLHRGLLATSPIFLLAPVGLVAMARKVPWRLTVLLGTTMAAYVLMISSTRIWYAGWGYGPRLLVPMMAWAMIPVAYGARTLWPHPLGQGLVRGLALAGFVSHQAVHAVFQELPETAQNPLMDVVRPALAAGLVSPNLGSTWLHLPGLKSLVPLATALFVIAGLFLFRETKARSWGAIALSGAVALLLGALPWLVAHHVGPTWKLEETNSFLQGMTWLASREAAALRP